MRGSRRRGRPATPPVCCRTRRLRSPLSRPWSPLLELHLTVLAVARRRSVSTLAAVTRVPVLGSRMTQAVAVDVA